MPGERRLFGSLFGGGREGSSDQVTDGQVTPPVSPEVPPVDEMPQPQSATPEDSEFSSNDDPKTPEELYADSADLERFNVVFETLKQQLLDHGFSPQDLETTQNVLVAAIQLQKEAEVAKSKLAPTTQLEAYAQELGESTDDEEIKNLSEQIVATVAQIRQKNASELATAFRKIRLPGSEITAQEALSAFLEYSVTMTPPDYFLAKGLSYETASRLLMDLCGFSYHDVMDDSRVKGGYISGGLQTRIESVFIEIIDRKKQRTGEGIDVSINLANLYTTDPATDARTALVEEALRAQEDVPDVSLKQAVEDFKRKIAEKLNK